MRNLKILFSLLILSILAIVITGVVLSHLGIEHGPLLIKIGFIFIVVNIVLYLLLLIFFVIRNLFNLYIEKKQKIIGSKFRTKLVIAFVGLTLIPSILLFILSNQLINSSVDKWFSLEVQRPLNDSMDIAKAFYSKEIKNAQEYADFLASNNTLADINKPVNSIRNLENSNGVKSEKGDYKVYLLKSPGESDFIQNVFRGITDTEIVSTEEGDIIRAASPIKRGNQISGVVVVETVISKNIVDKLESIRKAYNEYHQIEVQQNPIKLLYFFVLTIATLLIIFLALWAALRIAKGITVPIRSLVEATETIAHGDLDFRIALKREDEIGLLINSFNRMVSELKEGKLSLERTYTESDRRRLSMEAILENINTGVIFLERSGRIAALNNAACSMLNLDRDKIIGKSHKELLGKIRSDDLNSMLKRLEEKDFKSTEGEIHAYIDGRPVSLRVYITVLKDSKNNFIGILVVFDDLTEIIIAQRALAWQEVARRIAHEIKNPLTPIKLSTERLLKKWDEKAEDFEEVLKRATKTIVKEVDSLRNLVNEFSRFGKMPRINLEPTNINSIIEEVLELYNDLREVKVMTSLQDTPEIDVDREQLKRALINLIDNAIQSKTERIWLNTSYDPLLEIIRIEVIDEGTGIGEEEKNKLFLPYFSTKKDGTGLGLTIVSTIISKHRGYIRVKDNEPKGTQFIIELPAGQR
jgi:two-component system nitrogen regulation sensor histidine kinase NtrY